MRRAGPPCGRLDCWPLAVALLATFLWIETRTPSPLVPLALLRERNVATANGIGVLWAAAMFAWFFLSALYLQTVLGYSPLLVGLAFLPSNLIMGAFSLGLSAKLVMRFGIKLPLAFGLALAAGGLLLFARAPVNGNFVVDVLPGMILLGFGAGIAFNPVLLAAMSGVKPSDSGLASGIVNTSFMMGGALGSRDPRQSRRLALGQYAGRWSEPARRAQRWTPRRLPRRRALRRRRRHDGLHAPAPARRRPARIRRAGRRTGLRWQPVATGIRKTSPAGI